MSYRQEYIRTSMSLDLGTLDALKKLAGLWGVPKAEVMRRAVKTAVMQENEKITNPTPNPLEALQYLQTSGGLSHEESSALREQIASERDAKRYWWEV
jgi:hypothetical protein